MNRILLLLALSILSLTSYSQDYSDVQEPIEYKPFRVDFMSGIAFIPSNIISGGIIFGVEPKYALSPRINSGIRLHGAGLVRSFYKLNLNTQEVQANASAMGSALLTTDYYFLTQEIRPFAGIGTGMYWYQTASFKGDAGANTDPTETKAGSKFGVMTRAGLEAYHIRFSVEYNFVGKSGRTKNSYLGVSAGFYLGGGKKKFEN